MDQQPQGGKIPVTETPNELTDELDILYVPQILRVLRQADSQIFSGWRHHHSIYDKTETLAELVDVATEIISQALTKGEEDESIIVLSGCGTSGRIAFFCATAFNRVLISQGGRPIFRYLISGGDPALISSREKVEDDPIAGADELKAISANAKKVLYIGITCGFSAAYVAGQLDFAIPQPSKYTTVLMGFNPAHLARNAPIENWHRTFRDVALELDKLSQSEKKEKSRNQSYFLLNPVVGPEPITGSTRMKGGTATKFLLEAIFGPAISRATNRRLPLVPEQPITTQDSRGEVLSLLLAYESVYRHTYLQIQQLEEVIKSAGRSLREGGHVYYIADGTFAILATVDASECPPTYGAAWSDVQCFTHGGWQTWGNKAGDLTSQSEQFQISLSEFEKRILPNLHSADTVIFLSLASNSGDYQKEVESLATKVKAKQAATFAITVARGDQEKNKNEKERGNEQELFLHHATFELPYLTLVEGVPAFAEIALKWALNSITTTAHILAGKVYKNRMIDVGVANNKLFARATGIIAELSGVSEERGREALLRSLYEIDQLDASILEGTISSHIDQAAKRKKVVPLALLLAANQEYSVAEAQKILNAEPIVRKLLLLNKNK